MKRLNIFVDETGEFGFGQGSSELYGVSFTFHIHSNNISLAIKDLNSRLERIGYSGMIHMADLVMHRGDYQKFNIKMRKSIFNAIYQFSRKISVKYCSIIIDKRYVSNSKALRKQLIYKINKMVFEHELFFKQFDKIVMYYDNGQDVLGTILNSIFRKFDNFEHKINFNHQEKRLFQVSDMLTFIDKYNYKYQNKMRFTKGEDFFFSREEIRKIIKELNKKRF